jgi:hypothetical protein
MTSFSKFNSFAEAVAEKAHNLGSNQLVIALSNSAPSAGNWVLTDITQISYTTNNGQSYIKHTKPSAVVDLVTSEKFTS